MDLALRCLPTQSIPDVLVSYTHADDAGVLRLRPDLALVQTVDYFSPIVDDPYTFGSIAAANALSDIYAMGARPVSALSVVGFPSGVLDPKILGDIFKGGLTVLDLAGVALLGGHSVKDDDVKFGYAVTGVIHPDQIRQNTGGKPGDHLILTKALGTGVIATATKKAQVREDDLSASIASMVRLNDAAARLCLEHSVSTMTDITGFGLVGHALEVARASGLTLSIDHSKLPLLPGALEYAGAGYLAGGLRNNQSFFGPSVEIGPAVPEAMAALAFDPQTSGGLLVFCPPSRSESLLAALRSADYPAAFIGRAEAATGDPMLILL